MPFSYNNSIKFEYDPNKSSLNQIKHGVTFEEIQKLWQTPHVTIPAKTESEPRFMVVGRLQEKFYSCIYTVRNEAIRLISARRSRQSEENIYYDYIKTYGNRCHGF